MTTPTFFDALGITLDATTADVTKAYRRLAPEFHPDLHPEHAERFKLITAAFNVLKNETSRLAYRRRARLDLLDGSDQSWARDWTAVTTPQRETPKSSSLPKFVFVERDGETKDDRRKRYARESQQFRYKTDPYYARTRREASKRSYAKKKS